MNGLALCAGYGGLELGLERVFDEYRTVCVVEGECFAVQHLIKKMEEGRLDYSPIWSNVRTFNGSMWRGKVDIISGGFPCQPYSTVGKQKGKEDERDLWQDFVRIIGEVRPGLLFFENVPAIVNGRLDDIILDLDLLGYSASWCVVSASHVGAPHRRSRWFLLGVNNTDSNGQRWDKKQFSSSRWQFDNKGICREVPNTSGNRPNKISNRLFIKNDNVSETQKSFTDSNGQRLERKNKPETKMGQKEPKVDKIWKTTPECGFWKIEPSMGRLVDGATDWVDKLRLLGNGVVPQQAAYALEILIEQFIQAQSSKC